MLNKSLLMAIDPGSIDSAFVILDHEYNIYDFGKVKNEELLEKIILGVYDEFAIELIASYGMAVGRDVFDTCIWIGRFWQASPCKNKSYVLRKDEKMNLCGVMKAKDTDIRKALIERFASFDFKNGKGTKEHPDKFYGFKADIWAAMAIGVTYLDRLKEEDGDGCESQEV